MLRRTSKRTKERLCLIMCAVGAVGTIAAMLQGASFKIFADSQTAKYRIMYFEDVLHQDVGWFDQQEVSGLAAEIQEDLSKIQEACVLSHAPLKEGHSLKEGPDDWMLGVLCRGLWRPAGPGRDGLLSLLGWFGVRIGSWLAFGTHPKCCDPLVGSGHLPTGPGRGTGAAGIPRLVWQGRGRGGGVPLWHAHRGGLRR